MGDRLGILCCANYRAELDAVLREEGYEECCALSYPPECLSRRCACEALRGSGDTRPTGSDQIILLGGACLEGCTHAGEAPLRIGHPRLGTCFEMVAPRTLLEPYLEGGSHLVSPGWLERWRSTIAAWGFDREGARAFFRESATRLVLLDTGVHPGSGERLKECTDHLDLPATRLPVGLDFFRYYLARQRDTWRLERERAYRRRLQAQASKGAADQAMTLDLIANLASVTTESEAVERIFDLFETLFAPGSLVCLLLARRLPVSLQTRPGPCDREEQAVHISRLMEGGGEKSCVTRERGFFLTLQHQGEVLGILECGGVALPEHLQHYLGLAVTIGRVCGLALG